MERESIGIFISEHPLKRVREALRVKTDCSIAELVNQRDGEFRRVGGMVTEHKKIRTRAGKLMMFATLDDLDAAVEIVVFDETLTAVEELIATDSTMLVKGKVDQREQGKISLVVSSVEKFDPSDAEIEKAKAALAKVAAAAPKALKRRVDAAQLPSTVIEDLRDLFERYPGRRSSCWRCTPARACGGSSSATTTASRRATPACARSWTASSGSPRPLPHSRRSTCCPLCER